MTSCSACKGMFRHELRLDFSSRCDDESQASLYFSTSTVGSLVYLLSYKTRAKLHQVFIPATCKEGVHNYSMTFNCSKFTHQCILIYRYTFAMLVPLPTPASIALHLYCDITS